MFVRASYPNKLVIYNVGAKDLKHKENDPGKPHHRDTAEQVKTLQ